jgi:hypothetical protein
MRERRFAMLAGKAPKAQFNIRIDEDLLRAYKEFCKENGLDPHGQIVNFMKRLVTSEFDFQDKLWEILRQDAK